MKKLCPSLAVVLLAFATILESQEAVSVIVNAANPAATATRRQVSGFFLKKETHWGNGVAVVPVDQSATSSLRASFSRDFLRQRVSAVQSYWQQQIFSGRGVPPPVRNSDREVIAFVQANPGAVAYVSAGATLPADVRVLKVEE
jgi:ABC-type phosphate transport system substrate-binding protein